MKKLKSPVKLMTEIRQEEWRAHRRSDPLLNSVVDGFIAHSLTFTQLLENDKGQFWKLVKALRDDSIKDDDNDGPGAAHEELEAAFRVGIAIGRRIGGAR